MKLDELREHLRTTQEEQPIQAAESTPAPPSLAQLSARIEGALGEVADAVSTLTGDAKPFVAHIEEAVRELFRTRLVVVEMSDESLIRTCVRCTKESERYALCPDCVFAVASGIMRARTGADALMSKTVELQCSACGTESLHLVRPKVAATLICPSCGAHGRYEP